MTATLTERIMAMTMLSLHDCLTEVRWRSWRWSRLDVDGVYDDLTTGTALMTGLRPCLERPRRKAVSATAWTASATAVIAVWATATRSMSATGLRPCLDRPRRKAVSATAWTASATGTMLEVVGLSASVITTSYGVGANYWDGCCDGRDCCALRPEMFILKPVDVHQVSRAACDRVTSEYDYRELAHNEPNVMISSYFWVSYTSRYTVRSWPLNYTVSHRRSIRDKKHSPTDSHCQDAAAKSNCWSCRIAAYESAAWQRESETDCS